MDLPARVALLLLGSGAAALLCELVWMRRLSLAFGSTGLALALTLSIYMAGLGLGGALAGRRPWARAPRGYGLLELGAAAWALAMPLVLGAALPLADRFPGLPGSLLAAALALGPPAVLHGATLPAATAALAGATAAEREGEGRQTGLLYASNTAGAVLGVLVGTLLLLPVLGVRGTECVAAGLGALVGLAALAQAPAAPISAAPSSAAPISAAPISAAPTSAAPTSIAAERPDWSPRVAVLLAGFCALSLEVAWSRLGALLLGGSVYAFATVLAVFLTGTALGAAWGRTRGASALGPALQAMGLLALLGSVCWRFLPHGLGLLFGLGGEAALGLGGALLLALAMGGAPVASGFVFTAALAATRGSPVHRGGPHAGPGTAVQAAGQVLAANTLGSVAGSLLTGLVLLPGLGLRGAVALVAALALLAGALLDLGDGPVRPRRSVGSRVLPVLAGGAVLLLAPRWDPALYSVGLYLHLADFVEPSPRAVERFAHEGFTLRSYEDGVSATVAVGESLATGNRWLSINGKVDASTGEDMPTQILSGQLPVEAFQAARGRAPDVLVVGLASGVTAARAMDAGARSMTVVELEPAVVRAAAWFSAANGDLLHRPGLRLVVDDARSWLRQRPPEERFDVIISEPSNPWITGVSNLFTQEYWELARSRLRPDGVFCQWLQLYSLPPQAMRGLLRTFLQVFPDARLYETIPGADALLITGPPSPDAPLAPSLGPEALRVLAGRAPLNTDDRPWVEMEAPRWLHRSTGPSNAALLREAGRVGEGPPPK